ncbi:MAG: acyl-CoA dehydrogenase family protein [Deltaproteobacteria bacterium]|nr:acyl-CoA dehydrogenase family protein [Deltaproteobacteria bacterium]
MDYQLTDNQREFQKDLAGFLQERIAPRAGGFEDCPRGEINDRMRENLKILSSRNFLGTGINDDSLDLVMIYLAGEEISRACASTFLSARSSAFMCGGALALFGSPEQKKKHLGRLLSADEIGAIAYTEEDAGSDISSITTSARRDGQDWLVNGDKNIVVNAPIADVFLVLALTDPDGGIEKGMSLFLVEKDSPGLTVGASVETMGMRGVPMASVEFKNCRASELMGEKPGKGYQQLKTLMTMGCISITSLCVGIGTACMEISTQHARQRRAFGRQIGKFQDIGFKLSDMFTYNDLGRMLGLRAAWAINTHEDDAGVSAACAKLFAGEAVTSIVNWGMQIFAGHGYIRGSDIERLYRDARFAGICEGTSEIQRALISTHELDRFKQV